MARTAAITRSDLYTLTFSKPALAGLADGTFTAVGSPDGVRSWIVDAHTGRFVEHGVLHSATLIKAAAVAGTAWRILAVVTAQKYLADMNRQLASMKVALEEIRQHLEQDRAGKLVGNLVYLRENAAAIAVGRISERELQALAVQIEAIDRESTQLLSAFEGTLHVQLLRLTALSEDAKGGASLPTSEVWDQIVAGINRIEQYLRALISATLGRLIANEQSLMLDADSHLAGQRKRNLEQAIRTLTVTKDGAHNRVRLKLEQIRQEIGARRLEVGSRGTSSTIGGLLLGPILTAPLLVKDLIKQRQLNEASRRLEEAQHLFGADSATTDSQLAALRAEHSFSEAIWGTKNANIRFTVGLSGGDGDIETISIELAEI